MEGLTQFVRDLGPARLGVIGGVTVLVLGFVIFMTTQVGAPNMALLYSNLEPGDSNQISNQLAIDGIPFEIRNNGQEILVPAEQVGAARLKMAEQGLSGSVVGYEIFDQEESLGTSSFLQEVNKTRALEGELSRTISSITSVKAARVHLVMPRRELFSRDIQEPTASIILKMRGAQRLDRTQVLAIQHLVATAVPRLKPTNISIVDDRGTLLHRGGEDGQAGTDTLDMRSQYEQRVQRNVQDLLERTLGFGKVRVEVRAEMDFTQRVINEETFDPEGQVLRSSESIEENSTSQEAGEETVSVANNLPNAPGADTVGGSQESATRTEERSNFEISRTRTNIVREPGEVTKLSVAVLVDGQYTRDAPAEGEEQGELVYEPRTAEEMEQIEALVKSAIGYDDQRGDLVEIVNMRFAEPILAEVEEDATYFGLSAQDIKELAKYLMLLLLAVLIVLLIVRPLMNRFMEAGPATVEGDDDLALLTDQSMGTPALAGAPGTAVGAFGGEEDGGEEEAMIDIAQIEGKVKASTMRKIGEIIDKHPEEAVSIIRNWMYQDST